MQDFNLISEVVNNQLVIKTQGYINNYGGERILKEYEQNCNGEIKDIIIDLKESKIINSIGISYLIEIIQMLISNNGKLVFTNLDPTVEKTFSIMGLLQFATLAESTDQIN